MDHRAQRMPIVLSALVAGPRRFVNDQVGVDGIV
jgi:hypothetical protein